MTADTFQSWVGGRPPLLGDQLAVGVKGRPQEGSLGEGGSLLWVPIPTTLCGRPCCSVARQNGSDPGPAEGAKDARQAKHTYPSSTSHHIPRQATEPLPLCHMTREGPKSCVLEFREQSMNVLILTGIPLGWF